MSKKNDAEQKFKKMYQILIDNRVFGLSYKYTKLKYHMNSYEGR